MSPFRPRTLLAAVLLAWPPGSALRPPGPEKPVRIVVTFAAGGASDIVARAISEPLAKALGQPVIVDNKPGAGGTLGGADVVRARARRLHADAVATPRRCRSARSRCPSSRTTRSSSSRHVAMLGVAPVLIMANPKTGPATLKDLPKAAAAPGYNFGSGGPGSIGHIVGEMTKAAMKIQMTHVPYRGGAPMTTDLIAGTDPGGHRRHHRLRADGQGRPDQGRWR